MIKRIVKEYLFDPEINIGKMVFLTGQGRLVKLNFLCNGLKKWIWKWWRVG